jgi:hypothetical protein
LKVPFGYFTSEGLNSLLIYYFIQNIQGKYMPRFLETIELKIGCYSHYIFMVSFLLFIVLAPTYGVNAVKFFLYSLAIMLLGLYYYIIYSKERLEAYKDMFIKKARSSLKLEDNTQILSLTKKGAMCNSLLEKKTRKDYDISLLFLSDDYITIATKCPKFHMFRFERHDRKKRWAIKDACSVNKEYRYSFIQSVHFNPDKKTLDIVLTSGFVEHIESDKPDADKAVVAIREKLRNSTRTIQTNIWRGTN